MRSSIIFFACITLREAWHTGRRPLFAKRLLRVVVENYRDEVDFLKLPLRVLDLGDEALPVARVVEEDGGWRLTLLVELHRRLLPSHPPEVEEVSRLPPDQRALEDEVTEAVEDGLPLVDLDASHHVGAVAEVGVCARVYDLVGEVPDLVRRQVEVPVPLRGVDAR